MDSAPLAELEDAIRDALAKFYERHDMPAMLHAVVDDDVSYSLMVGDSASARSLIEAARMSVAAPVAANGGRRQPITTPEEIHALFESVVRDARTRGDLIAALAALGSLVAAVAENAQHRGLYDSLRREALAAAIALGEFAKGALAQ